MSGIQNQPSFPDKFKPTRRGGARVNAGRPLGRKTKATLEAKATLSELAREYTQVALDALVRVASSLQSSDSATVAAAVALLDRGYGRPSQSIDVTGASSGPVLNYISLAGMEPDVLEELRARALEAIKASDPKLLDGTPYKVNK